MLLAIRLVRLLILPIVVFLTLTLAILGTFLETPFAVIWLVAVSLFFSPGASKRSWIAHFPTSLRGTGCELAFLVFWAWNVDSEYQREKARLNGSAENMRVFFRIAAISCVCLIGALYFGDIIAVIFVVLAFLILIADIVLLFHNFGELEKRLADEKRREAEAQRLAEARRLAEERREAEARRLAEERREAEARRQAAKLRREAGSERL